MRHYLDIARQLREMPEGDDTLIEVVSHTDSICAPCPNRRDLLCTTEDKVQALDARHAEVLELKAGDRLTWREAKERIKRKIDVEVHGRICDPCGWKPYGICEKALLALKNSAIVLVMGSCLFLQGLHSNAQEPVLLNQLIKDRTGLAIQGSVQNRKALKTLKVIYKKIQDGQWSDIPSVAAPLVKNQDWGDYALYSLVIAQQKKIQSKKFERAQWKQEAQKGLRHALELRNRFPSSPLVKRVAEAIGHFHWTIAETSTGVSQYILALDWLEQANGAIYSVSPEQLSHFAKACFLNRDEVCEAWVRRLLNLFPRASLEYKALMEAFSKKPLDNAKTPSYSRTAQVYRDADPDLRAIDQAVLLYLEGKESDAKDALKKFLDEFPKSVHRFRAKYWLNEHDAVFSENTLGNYGLLSALKIQKSPKEQVMQMGPKTDIQALPRSFGLSPAELVRLTRAEQLLSVNATEFASRELEGVRASASDLTEYLAYLAVLQNRVSNHWLAFGVLSELIQRSEPSVYSTEFLKLIFPLEKWDVIQKIAQENELDPVLLISQIKQESGFYTRAVSSKGATGWMQLMPATAVEVDPSLKIGELVDFETNLRTGAKYLKKMVDRFGGNMAYALAGYNAGPYAADRWVKNKKSEWGPTEFVESITYRETREYVWSIIRNYYWYSTFRLDGKNFPGLEYFFQTKPQT